MAEGKGTTELAPILSLKPGYIDQLHLHAMERYYRFLGEVHEELSEGELTDEDLKLYLSEEERVELNALAREIAEWLVRCRKDSGEASLLVYPYSSSINYSMSGLKSLLRTAAERKAKEANKEAEKKRRLEALQEINPPLEDAKQYLTAQECEQFLNSLPGAVDAYLDGGKGCILNDWRFDRRASSYIGLTGIIKERKEKKARKKQAEIEHDRYLDRLSATVEKFRAELAKGKGPKFVYPPELEKYQPDSWCDLDSPSQQQIQNWAEPKILARLPEILANLTRWELTWQVRVLPNAAYEAEAGIPCLTWYSKSNILVMVNLELKKCVIRERRSGYTVEVQAEGKKLGTLYIGPVEWLTPGSFTTPIALLRLLAMGTGELEAPGITVTDRSPPFMTFAIQGLEEEVELDDDFRRFIKDICKEQPLAQALFAQGIIDEDTAKLVEAKWDQALPVSGEPGETGGWDLESVVAKLVELGLTEANAKKAVETTTLPKNATTEEIVSIILHKSY